MANKQELEATVPIVVELGKQRKRRIRDLKRGRGKLMDEVADVIDQVKTDLGDEAAGKVVVPIVVVYRKKSKRKNKVRLFPF